jgi:hypothetical protein
MSDLIVPSRRGFILGAALSLLAAPAIVRAANLMAVKPFEVLAATGFDVPIDLADYQAQYAAFQKDFLGFYRKEHDPVKAKAFDVVGVARKIAPSAHYERMPESVSHWRLSEDV